MSDPYSQQLTIALPPAWWASIRQAIQASERDHDFNAIRGPALRKIDAALSAANGAEPVSVTASAIGWNVLLNLILRHSPEGSWSRNAGEAISRAVSLVQFSKRGTDEE